MNLADTEAVVQAVDGALHAADRVTHEPSDGGRGHPGDRRRRSRGRGNRCRGQHLRDAPAAAAAPELGADIVMHSATKFIAGHPDVILGAVVTADDDLWTSIELRRRSLGAIPARWKPGSPCVVCGHSRYEWSGHSRTRHSWPSVCSNTRGSAGCATRVCREIRAASVPRRRCRASARSCRSSSVVRRRSRAAGLREHAAWVHATSPRRRRVDAGTPSPLADRGPDDPRGPDRLAVGIEHPADLWADLEQALRNGT